MPISHRERSASGPVNASLAEVCDGLPPRLGTVVRDAISGGKRLRPMILKAWFDACEGRGCGWVHGAIAVELVHRASLAHDDLPSLDADLERNGNPTVHAQHGPAAALLAGDAMLALAFRVMAEGGLPSEAVSRLSSTVIQMCDGQVDDVLGSRLMASAWWTDVCDRKTGSLFAAAAVIGTIAAGGTEQDRNDAHAFGLLFGRLYQLLDDVADGDEYPTGMLAQRQGVWTELQAVASRCPNPEPVIQLLAQLRARLESSHSKSTCGTVSANSPMKTSRQTPLSGVAS